MRIYLDTASYINLIERANAGISPDEFCALLSGNGHTVIYSCPLICELISPMWDPDSQTVVTPTLNRLEEFPHQWIDIVGLPNLEVRLALRYFRDGINYPGVDPYVGNFADTLSNPPTAMRLALHYPIAEAAFDLRNSGCFNPQAQNANHLHLYRELMRRDRELVKTVNNRQQARRTLFIERIVQRIQRERLHDGADEGNTNLFQAAAEHVYDHSDWCPSLRLGFGMFHSILDDFGDNLSDGDLGDLAHIQALPYVDYYITDRRIAAHVERVSRTLGVAYQQKLRPNIAQLVDVLT